MRNSMQVWNYHRLSAFQPFTERLKNRCQNGFPNKWKSTTNRTSSGQGSIDSLICGALVEDNKNLLAAAPRIRGCSHGDCHPIQHESSALKTASSGTDENCWLLISGLGFVYYDFRCFPMVVLCFRCFAYSFLMVLLCSAGSADLLSWLAVLAGSTDQLSWLALLVGLLAWLNCIRIHFLLINGSRRRMAGGRGVQYILLI